MKLYALKASKGENLDHIQGHETFSKLSFIKNRATHDVIDPLHERWKICGVWWPFGWDQLILEDVLLIY